MPSARGVARIYLEVLIVTLMAATFARTFLAQGLRISSGSMEEALLVGDHVLVNRFLFAPSGSRYAESFLPIRSARRGEIVVLRFPQDPTTLFVKRCIGLPGEQVDIVRGRVLIDGLALDESAYLDTAPTITAKETPSGDYSVRVPDDHFFVLGDRRGHSFDSRHWGSVPAASLVGRPIFVYWSWNERARDVGETQAQGRFERAISGFLGATRWRRTFSTVR